MLMVLSRMSRLLRKMPLMSLAQWWCLQAMFSYWVTIAITAWTVTFGAFCLSKTLSGELYSCIGRRGALEMRECTKKIYSSSCVVNDDLLRSGEKGLG
jgi:hypothetical protein